MLIQKIQTVSKGNVHESDYFIEQSHDKSERTSSSSKGKKLKGKGAKFGMERIDNHNLSGFLKHHWKEEEDNFLTSIKDITNEKFKLSDKKIHKLDSLKRNFPVQRNKENQAESIEEIKKKLKLTPNSSKDSVISSNDRSIKSTTTKIEVSPTPKPYGLRKRKEEKIEIKKTFYDLKKHEFYFEIEDSGTPKKRHIKLSRRELLERNPKLLLYYYETLLQFPKNPEFDPQTLLKLAQQF